MNDLKCHDDLGTYHDHILRGYQVKEGKYRIDAFNDNNEIFTSVFGESREEAEARMKVNLPKKIAERDAKIRRAAREKAKKLAKSPNVTDSQIPIIGNELLRQRFGSTIYVKIDQPMGSSTPETIIGDSNRYGDAALRQQGFVPISANWISENKDPRIAGNVPRPSNAIIKKNGRYILRSTSRKDGNGNDIYEMELDSISAGKHDRHQLPEIGITIGSKR